MASDTNNPESTVSSPAFDGLVPGSIINNAYLILQELGSGGKATVYLARDLMLDGNLAIKFLHNVAASGDQDSHEQFRREAKISARLQHPNIVRVKSFGISEGKSYLVMEYVKGISLQEYIHSHGAMPLPQALVTFRALAEALAYAHEAQVLHLDIKPANIMLEGDKPECPKLLDFGLARTGECTAVAQDGTLTRTIAGSPAYMSPEQCKGAKLDARSDVYSLAVTMFEAITGKRLFDGNTELAVMSMHLNDTPAFPEEPAIPANIRTIISKCLNKNPADRFQTARELLSQLTQIDTVELKSWKASTPKRGHSRSLLLLSTALLLIISTSVLCLIRTGKLSSTAHSTALNTTKIQQHSSIAHPSLGMAARAPDELAKDALKLFNKNGRQDPEGTIGKMYLAAINGAKNNKDQLAVIQAEYSNYLLALNKLPEALCYTNLSVHLVNSFPAKSSVRYKIYRNAVRCYSRQSDGLRNAEESFKIAMKAMADYHAPAAISYQKALLLEDMADLYQEHHMPKQQMEKLKESIEADPGGFPESTRRCVQLAALAQDRDPEVFRQEMARYERTRHEEVDKTHQSLMNIAERCAEKNDLSDAIKYARYAIDDIRRDREPSLLRKEYAHALLFLARTCAASKDTSAARNYSDEVRSKYREYLSKSDLEALMQFSAGSQL